MKNNKLLVAQIKNIIDPNIPLVSNLSNVSSILNQMENINWVGFYLIQNDTLYLGPFQGDVACTIIPKGKGVCGTSFEKKETIIVPNVNEFKGHIACSSLSKSEIVVPIIKNGEVKALIDVDAPIFDRFSIEDKLLLEEVASLLAPLF
ncbi:MAG: GAF domain-containing protein [Bacilli bacterium]|nr:GAF domain-containing protein [Bacilli bacterium]